MNHWVMDYETLSNCFTAVFEHYKTEERKIFVIHELRDDRNDFIKFLEQNVNNREWHISYNGLAFDAQVTHYIIENCSDWEELEASAVARIIYAYAQKTIESANNKQFSDYALWQMSIGQIDMFKMHHWDNPAKRSSLKWIQYSMDWENIIDMPISHTTEISTQEEIDTIIKYCVNDVSSTKEIFNRSKSLVSLRKVLTKEYGINLFSASEPRISKELFGYYLSRNLNIPKYELKKMRSHRSVIKFKDIILPYIKFQSPEFQRLLERFKSVELDPSNLRGGFKYKVKYKNIETHFGLGGAHGARVPGVYTSDEDYVIMSSDVTSFYPNLVIRNRWSPGHFPAEQFCDQYEWFFEERKKIPKSNPMNYVYKIILNSTFGLSNDINSFFYDPELCMRITVNGQLTLMMLYEMIMEAIPEAFGLLQNTDGIEIKIPRREQDKYLEICAEWERITNLQLEHDEYDKLILGDVNNYIAQNKFKMIPMDEYRELRKSSPHYKFKVEQDKFYVAPTKLKGRFDFHSLMLHKNKSKLVIKKAIYNYFIHDILPEDYLETNRNILDYCIGGKSKGNWEQHARSIENDILKEEKLQKINRYYISKTGVKIVKVNKLDGREIQLESGKWLQTVYNDMKVEPKWENYNIDKAYYMQAIEQEINNILNVKVNQLELF